MRSWTIRKAGTVGVIAFAAGITLGLSACIHIPWDRATIADRLRPSQWPGEETEGQEPENLAQRVPPDATAPVVEFFFGAEYVNTSGVKLSWVNPTDKTWYVLPDTEKLVVEKRRPFSKGPRDGVLIGTRVELGDSAQVRCGTPETAIREDKRGLDLPHGFELDDWSLIWPGIVKHLADGAATVASTERLALPPHSQGHITTLFLAYNYRRAVFTVQMTDGTYKADFSLALDSTQAAGFGSPFMERLFYR